MKNKGTFNDYLKQRGLSRSTINTNEVGTGRFLSWLKGQGIQPEQAGYTDVLAYMKYCQKKGAVQRTVQHYMNCIKNFYDYLATEQRVKVNPVLSIKIQGVKRKMLYRIIEPHDLHAIYYSYQGTTLSGRKNKVIIGLLVYQGLKTEELDNLEVKDVKLKEGRIEVPGGRKSESRTLQLESHQVLDMYDYVMQVRGKILVKTRQQTDKLFVSLHGGNKFRPAYLLGQIKLLYPRLESLKHLRASVIVRWLRQYNLREVQYLAGHRYISSTEQYLQSEMEGLTEEVNKFHPLG